MTDDRGRTDDMSPAPIMTFFSSKLAKPTPLSKLRPQLGGTLFAAVVAVLMATTPFLAFTWHLARLLGACFPTRVDAERVKNSLYSYFLRLAIALFVRAPGLKLHLYGDAKSILASENVLYMSNHQSSVDWLVAAILAKRAGCLPHIKFIMKQELHWVPLVGYYLKILGHIYVRRKGFNPQRLIERVEEYKKAGTPVWMGIFPEGTRFNPDDRKTIAAAQEFARNSNQQPLQHQLTPRPKGSWLLLSNLGGHLQAVYNVTLVYEQPEPRGQRLKPPSAADVLRGHCTDVHVHVKRIPIADVPTEEANFITWLHGESLDRDKRLAAFYSTRSFASWGPAAVEEAEDATDTPACAQDVALVALMLLLLAAAPWARTMYWLTALAATLGGYVALQLRPPF